MLGFFAGCRLTQGSTSMAKFHFSPDGKIDLDGHNLSRFAIKNLAQIVDYSVIEEDGVVTHRFVFSDGGSVRIKFDAVAGRYDLDSKAVTHTLSDDLEKPGHVVLTFSQAT
jgi:hypothetical protein